MKTIYFAIFESLSLKMNDFTPSMQLLLNQDKNVALDHLKTGTKTIYGL